MPTVAQLNVEIGARIKGLQDGIRQSERELRRAGKTLSGLGGALTMRLSLPLLGIGAAAIKTAGEMEALKKGMIATFAGSGRSAEAATAEVDALRKAAEAPGLDFEQAVKASLRLQGVGFSAEKARNTIVQLANAIASTGGTAENLNGVTVQFAQMISKGKILTSDLNVIKENMPGLAKIMQETFGTTSADALRDMGINGKQFVEQITAAMEKLPRVEGGISNSIVNAGIAIKMFLADVGESLNKTFNVTGKLDAFSTFLGGLGKKFTDMSEGTKTAIFGIGVFALALGPAIKAGNLFIQVGGGIYKAMSLMRIAMAANELAFAQTGKGINVVTMAWKAMDGTMKMTVMGAAIGLILAAAAAFAVLKKDMSAAAVAQRTITDVTKSAQESIVSEKIKVQQLVAVINEQTNSTEKRKAALNELKAISPEYFSQLSIEKGKTIDLTAATEAYIQSITRAANVKAAIARKEAIATDRLNVKELADPTILQTTGNALNTIAGRAVLFATGLNLVAEQTTFAARQTASLTKNTEELTAGWKAEEAALDKLIAANQGAVAPMKAATTATRDGAGASKEAAKQTSVYREALADVNKELSKQALLGGTVNARITAISSGIDKLLDAGFSEKSKEVQRFLQLLAQARSEQGGVPGIPSAVGIMAAQGINSSMAKPIADRQATKDVVADIKVTGIAAAADEMSHFVTVSGLVQTALEAMSAKTGELGVGFADIAQGLSKAGKVMAEASLAASGAMVESAAAGESSFKSLGQTALASAAKVVRAELMKAVAAGIAKAMLTSANPLVGLVVGGIAGAAVGVLFNKVVGALGIKGFAKGTNSAPGGLALVGELGPELMNVPRGAQITPANQTTTMLRGMMNGGGGETTIIPSVRVAGSDLLIVFDRAQKQKGRIG